MALCKNYVQIIVRDAKLKFGAAGHRWRWFYIGGNGDGAGAAAATPRSAQLGGASVVSVPDPRAKALTFPQK